MKSWMISYDKYLSLSMAPPERLSEDAMTKCSIDQRIKIAGATDAGTMFKNVILGTKLDATTFVLYNLHACSANWQLTSRTCTLWKLRLLLSCLCRRYDSHPRTVKSRLKLYTAYPRTPQLDC